LGREVLLRRNWEKKRTVPIKKRRRELLQRKEELLGGAKILQNAMEEEERLANGTHTLLRPGEYTRVLKREEDGSDKKSTLIPKKSREGKGGGEVMTQGPATIPRQGKKMPSQKKRRREN